MPRWEVAWSAQRGTLATEYAVRGRPRGAVYWTEHGSTRSTSILLDLAETPDVYEVAIAPLVQGLEAPDDDWTIVEIRPNSTADLTVPDDVADFSAAQDGARVVCTWTAVDAPDLDYYEIRQGTAWDTGVKVATAPKDATRADFGWWASGSTKLLIKARTQAGLWSDAADEFTLVVEDESYMPAQATTDEHSGGYTGTKTNVEVSGGNLQPTALPASYASWSNTYTTYTHPWWWPYIPGGTYVTAAQDAGAVVHEKVEVGITPTPVDSAPSYSTWLGQLHPEFDDAQDAAPARSMDALHVYDRIAADETLIDGAQVDVEIDTTPDDPAGSPTWDGWRPWVPGCIYRYRGVRLRVTLGMLWPFIYPRLTAFTWKRRRQNRKDEQSVTISSTGGTTVTWDTTFTQAPKVTVQFVGTTSWFAVVSGIDTSGCTVRLFNDAGTEQAGGAVVHVHALGV